MLSIDYEIEAATVVIESRPWSDLPPEILEMIKFRYVLTSPANVDNFSSVCKQWREILPVFWADGNGPLLLHYSTPEDGACNYYVPALNKTFSVDSPLDLSGTIFHYASGGWLLLSRGEYSFLLVNPLTGAFHKIPDLLDGRLSFQSVAFSAPPPMVSASLPDDFTIFGMSNYEEYILFRVLHGQGDWSEEKFLDSDSSFVSADSNPVFYHNLFYCLGNDGRLGTFDPVEVRWTILDKPRPMRTAEEGDQCFLVKSEEELVSVFVEQFRKKVRVFKLNRSRMKWERVTRLEDDRALFVGSMASTMSKVKRSMSNKVFFPRVFGDPEVIPATVRKIDGRFLFVPKLDCNYNYKDREIDERENKEEHNERESDEGACYYPFDREEKYKYYKSKGYLFSVWYDLM